MDKNSFPSLFGDGDDAGAPAFAPISRKSRKNQHQQQQHAQSVAAAEAAAQKEAEEERLRREKRAAEIANALKEKEAEEGKSNERAHIESEETAARKALIGDESTSRQALRNEKAKAKLMVGRPPQADYDDPEQEAEGADEHVASDETETTESVAAAAEAGETSASAEKKNDDAGDKALAKQKKAKQALPNANPDEHIEDSLGFGPMMSRRSRKQVQQQVPSNPILTSNAVTSEHATEEAPASLPESNAFRNKIAEEMARSLAKQKEAQPAQVEEIKQAEIEQPQDQILTVENEKELNEAPEVEQKQEQSEDPQQQQQEEQKEQPKHQQQQQQPQKKKQKTSAPAIATPSLEDELFQPIKKKKQHHTSTAVESTASSVLMAPSSATSFNNKLAAQIAQSLSKTKTSTTTSSTLSTGQGNVATVLVEDVARGSTTAAPTAPTEPTEEEEENDITPDPVPSTAAEEKEDSEVMLTYKAAEKESDPINVDDEVDDAMEEEKDEELEHVVEAEEKEQHNDDGDERDLAIPAEVSTKDADEDDDDEDEQHAVPCAEKEALGHDEDTPGKEKEEEEDTVCEQSQEFMADKPSETAELETRNSFDSAVLETNVNNGSTGDESTQFLHTYSPEKMFDLCNNAAESNSVVTEATSALVSFLWKKINDYYNVSPTSTSTVTPAIGSHSSAVDLTTTPVSQQHSRSMSVVVADDESPPPNADAGGWSLPVNASASSTGLLRRNSTRPTALDGAQIGDDVVEGGGGESGNKHANDDGPVSAQGHGFFSSRILPHDGSNNAPTTPQTTAAAYGGAGGQQQSHSRGPSRSLIGADGSPLVTLQHERDHADSCSPLGSSQMMFSTSNANSLPSSTTAMSAPRKRYFDKSQLHHRVLAVLNKVVPNSPKWKEVVFELQRLPLPTATDEQLDKVVEVIFTKAMQDQGCFVPLYADLCFDLTSVPEGQKGTGDPEKWIENRLKRVLLTRCEHMVEEAIEAILSFDDDFGSDDDFDEEEEEEDDVEESSDVGDELAISAPMTPSVTSTSPTAYRTQLLNENEDKEENDDDAEIDPILQAKALRDEERAYTKRKHVGNICFIAELYAHHVIPGRLIHRILHECWIGRPTATGLQSRNSKSCSRSQSLSRAEGADGDSVSSSADTSFALGGGSHAGGAGLLISSADYLMKSADYLMKRPSNINELQLLSTATYTPCTERYDGGLASELAVDVIHTMLKVCGACFAQDTTWLETSGKQTMSTPPPVAVGDDSIIDLDASSPEIQGGENENDGDAATAVTPTPATDILLEKEKRLYASTNILNIFRNRLIMTLYETKKVPRGRDGDSSTSNASANSSNTSSFATATVPLMVKPPAAAFNKKLARHQRVRFVLMELEALVSTQELQPPVEVVRVLCPPPPPLPPPAFVVPKASQSQKQQQHQRKNSPSPQVCLGSALRSSDAGAAKAPAQKQSAWQPQNETAATAAKRKSNNNGRRQSTAQQQQVGKRKAAPATGNSNGKGGGGAKNGNSSTVNTKKSKTTSSTQSSAGGGGGGGGGGFWDDVNDTSAAASPSPKKATTSNSNSNNKDNKASKSQSNAQPATPKATNDNNNHHNNSNTNNKSVISNNNKSASSTTPAVSAWGSTMSANGIITSIAAGSGASTTSSTITAAAQANNSSPSPPGKAGKGGYKTTGSVVQKVTVPTKVTTVKAAPQVVVQGGAKRK